MTGLSKRDADDISQGRAALDEELVAHLADALSVTFADLTQPIDPRARLALAHPSFRSPSAIWNVVLQRPELTGVSDKALSTILGVDDRRVGEARRGNPSRSLGWIELDRLARHLGLDIDAILDDRSSDR